VNFARVVRTSSTAADADLRVSPYDWTVLSEDLSGSGCAVIEKLLSPEDCQQIAELYPEEGHFRSHIHMARHGFGKGEYRYFKYPLPPLIGGFQVGTMNLRARSFCGKQSGSRTGRWSESGAHVGAWLRMWYVYAALP
jgi:hypothetical protein